MNTHQPTENSAVRPKRKRGGQPGNMNARGNRGNRLARGMKGNRGGAGAPMGNQFARKLRTLADELLKEYADVPEAQAWLAANESALREEALRSDTVLDRAMHLGIPVGE